MTAQLRAQREIRKIRREMRFDQFEFAKLMNVSHDTIFSWEVGYRSPIKGTLLSIWWRGPIEAALVANRVFQVAFDESGEEVDSLSETQKALPHRKITGQIEITERQKQILQCLAEGDTRMEVATDLRLSHSWIGGLMTTLFKKIGAKTSAQAVAIAIRKGWIC